MRSKIIFILATICLSMLSCRSNNNSTEAVSDSSSNIVQSAYSQAGSAAGSTEGGSIGFMSEDLQFADQAIESANTESVHPLSACSYSSFTCSGATKTMNWNACTIGAATLTGGWVETYSSAGCCTTFTSGSCSVTRIAGTSGSIVTTAEGATLTTTSEDHTAYDGTTISGSTGVTSSNSSGTRTVAINGLHRILTGPRGTTWFNHSLKTSTPLNITGTRAAGTRTINSGALQIFHNIAGYTATTTFSSSSKVTWANSACCYPTSGQISTVFTGAKTGTATLTFSSTCGSATFVDTDSTSSTITLNQCE